jgi:phospholipid/cholesterol/gamma-HCH transport system substrate-binding protein
MRSRTLREGSVGLLILLGAGLFGGLVIWLRGISPGNRSYSLEVELQDASGIEVGSTVRYRGVKVGTITGLRTDTDRVKVIATISPATLLIPRQSLVETTQSGFIGQVFLDFRPPDTQLVTQANNLSPFQPNCNPKLILCDGDRVQGKLGANFDALIRSTTEIAELLNQSNLIASASTTLNTANSTLNRFDRTAGDLSAAAKSINTLSVDARGQLRSLNTASTAVTQAANQVTSLVQTNRGSVSGALKNLDAAGQELRVAINGLEPFISRLNKSKALDNLELLADNGAAAAANLKSLSGAINNPITILGLAQTLDAARATFVNTQKITNDLQQVTGDANFRKNLLNLIRGLSRLLSSSQELQQHLQALQTTNLSPAPQPVQPVVMGQLAGQPWLRRRRILLPLSLLQQLQLRQNPPLLGQNLGQNLSLSNPILFSPESTGTAGELLRESGLPPAAPVSPEPVPNPGTDLGTSPGTNSQGLPSLAP